LQLVCSLSAAGLTHLVRRKLVVESLECIRILYIMNFEETCQGVHKAEGRETEGTGGANDKLTVNVKHALMMCIMIKAHVHTDSRITDSSSVHIQMHLQGAHTWTVGPGAAPTRREWPFCKCSRYSDVDRLPSGRICIWT
jgi:hypothetical protein